MKDDYAHSHYGWLEANLVQFFKNLGRKDAEWWPGIISAHGDKGYLHKCDWAEHGICFEHGMALFLLAYMKPYRRTEVYDPFDNPTGMHIKQWVINNYLRFKPFLPKSFAEQEAETEEQGNDD